MKINKLLTAYNHDKGSTSRIKYIVIHYVGALGGAKANCQYYAGGNRGASAHYYVDFDGAIWQSVEDANIAWHCGSKTGYKHSECRNANSIGIELCVRKENKSHLNSTDKDWYFEDETVQAAAELTKYLMDKYGIPAKNVIRHYDVTGKICPNPFVYNTGKHTWDSFKAALVASSSGVAAAPGSTANGIKPLQGKVKVIYKGADGLNVRKAPSMDAEVDQIVKSGTFTVIGISADGKWYKLKSGLYITTGKEYVTFTASAAASFAPYSVKVNISDLNIRKGAGINFESVGCTGKGTFTIVAEATGKVDSRGNVNKWGLLKAYEKGKNGWICLDYVKKV